MSDFPYSIPERRALTTKEREIVRLLLAKSAANRLAEIEKLEVYARCGCGKCPTVMFQYTPKKEGASIVADFQGGDDSSGRVGIMLWEEDGVLAELEAWSIDGRDVIDWPELSTIRDLDPHPPQK